MLLSSVLLSSVFLSADAAFNYYSDCKLTDAVCVVCDKTKMMGAVRMDAIFTESLAGSGSDSYQLLALAKFNSVRVLGCVSNFRYNGANVNHKHFTFEMTLGACSMETDTITHNDENYISFRQELTFDESTLKEVFFGSMGKYGFTCNYKATASTEDKEYDVEVRAVGKEVEKFVAWDGGMNINFYSDARYVTKMTPNSLVVGERFFYEVQWAETFTADMPVVFYAIDCTVNEKASPSKNYKIIDDGCYSDLTQVNLESASKYVTKNLHHSYKSFSFDNTVGTVNLQLSCNMGFCLKTQVTAGTCGPDDTCPTGYST